MRLSRPSRVSRIRGTVLAVVAATVMAFPLGVLASHQFADVPNSNIFHNDIDALVDAGITAGCGGGNYCPNQAVTRGQMAAFMNRLGALAPGKTPVVNADRVDGFHATDLVPGGNLPFGTTIRGVWAINGDAGDLVWQGYSFGYRLAFDPVPHFIPAGTIPPAACDGTASNPQADPGHLCVYEAPDNVGGNPDFDCVFDGKTDDCGTADRSGFAISQFGSGSDWFSGGTWAVTQGLSIILPLNEGDGRSPSGPADE